MLYITASVRWKIAGTWLRLVIRFRCAVGMGPCEGDTSHGCHCWLYLGCLDSLVLGSLGYTRRHCVSSMNWWGWGYIE